MNKLSFKTLVFLFAILSCMETGLSASALADKGGKGHKTEEGLNNSHDDKVTIVIGSHDREIIKDYLRQDYRHGCPPGLAKKHNGCLPPGQAKKYRIGQALPDNVSFEPLPKSILDLLSPAPQGYQYVKVDKDVALMSEAGKKIIDAVTLISAVGK